MLGSQKRCTAQDLKIAAAIEHKRRVEEARKARIFNPRLRKIGVDKEFLDKQVEEKKRLQDLEREHEGRMDEALIRNSQLAILLQRQQDKERRKFNHDIVEYRQNHQKVEFRRDFDLYDPELVKKSKPARNPENDKQLGVASAQKFEGEDANGENRRRAQQEQMQSWILQQVHERRSAERERREAEKAYQEALLARDRRALELDQMERQCRKRLDQATARFNKALALEQEERKRSRAAKDLEDARAEIYNHVTGDFLTEAPEQAASVHGPGKPMPDRYKGMSAAQLQEYRAAQARQMQQIQLARQEESAQNERWEKMASQHARAAETYQRESDRSRAELNKKIAEENLRLAEQQKLHQDYLNKDVYKQKTDPEFYKQFNRSTR